MESVPGALTRKVSDHYIALTDDLTMAFRGNIDVVEVNGYLRAAEHEAEALLATLRAETARNLRSG